MSQPLQLPALMWNSQGDLAAELSIIFLNILPPPYTCLLYTSGVEINTTVFRGELSEGMMCSLKELGLTLHDFPYALSLIHI